MRFFKSRFSCIALSSVSVLGLSVVAVAQTTNTAGFNLSVDGVQITGDPRIMDRVRRTDRALAQADVKVRYDSGDLQPRLNLIMTQTPPSFETGARVQLGSVTNYPAYLKRAEIRILDRGAIGGPKLLDTVPVALNGRADLVLPKGNDLVAVLRVYGKRGRFDETHPLPLSQADDRGPALESGTDFAATRRVRVNGGAVTVTAENVSQGAVLRTLGEAVRPDPSGNLVIQRILPPGEHVIDVELKGGAKPVQLSREVSVPGPEWFYVGIADLEIARTRDRDSGTSDTRTTGRLAYYLDGETDSGVTVTSSLDSGVEELSDLFRRLDERDPRAVLGRVDPQEGFLTFGDDSTIRDNAPSSGKFFLRVEKDGNFALWGDYQATVEGSAFLRNERTLYGAQGYFASEEETARGQSKVEVELYASEPDQLVGRETFRGTGGSVYFLREQDVTPGTETLSVELRDVETGRVIDRRRLIVGRDYTINYLQGVIVLTAPLSDSFDTNLITTNPGGDGAVNLVANYEFTPTAGNIDGFSFGGRAEAWITSDLRFGATVINESTGAADQDSFGLDLRYVWGENSFAQLDYARSEGPGFASIFSSDGGLSNETVAADGGTGDAVKLEVQADLTDLGSGREGVVGGYVEQREQGFSTLDYQTTALTGDETLYGAFARVEPGERLGWSIYADRYENEVGASKTEIGGEVEAAISDQLSFTVGLEHLDRDNALVSGNRTDVAARLDYAVHSRLTYSVFGQATLDADGIDEYNRLGLGITRDFGNGWTLEGDISEGTGGVGGRILANYARDENSSHYFGYELDPGRAIDAGIDRRDNGGRFVQGARHRLNSDISIFAENVYDIFGPTDTLNSGYGVEYRRSDFLTYDVSLELGDIQDETNGDFERTALSFGVRYAGNDLTARARLELRRERGGPIASPTDRDADTTAFLVDGRYDFDDSQRLLFSVGLVDTDADSPILDDASYSDLNLGYAYRPVTNERLNVLAGYRYLDDMFGQTVDGVTGAGPVQRSHVLSLEGSYDLNDNWTLGAKLGGRRTETAASAADVLQSNDATLAVINARYHLVKNWDVLLEARSLTTENAGDQTSVLGAAYRHVGDNAKIGLGYNFGDFSDDLTDLTRDDEGLFLNLIAKF